ncbi:glycosyltransferase [Tabrizicola sp.]|uniref:glycosyltransferase n=1 Tax=Tabrizicola sp. TaxID=2005166 RepID=UPI003F359F29
MYPVVHVIDTLSVGGAQRLLTILATAAETACPVVLDLRGHSSAMADEIARRGVRIESGGIKRSLNPVDWWRLWRALRRLPSGLVHLHLTDSVIMGAPLARLMRRKVVVTVHNTLTVPPGTPSARLKRMLEGFALRHFTDHAILVGDRVAKANQARLDGVPQTILPNVIMSPPAISPEARAEFRKAAGVGEGEVVFVSTGRLHPQKDHMTMLAAFARLRQSGHRVVLWALGEGHERDRLLARAEALQLGAACRFLGTQADVPMFLAAADVFLMSSAWEGLPLGLLEGMAAGLPVVATAVGDLPSILGEEGGILVPPGDPERLAAGMEALAVDATLRADYAARSARIVAPYLDVDAWLAGTLAIYRSVLGERDG